MRMIQQPNPLARLADLVVSGLKFGTVLDWGRYLVRLDVPSGQGYFRSEIRQGEFVGHITLKGKVATADAEWPRQVAIALERAGYSTE